MRSFALLLIFGVAACATQREQRISSAEARDRPPDEACEPHGAPPATHADGKPARTPVWACGYWHWDGVRYIWIDGSWQAR